MTQEAATWLANHLNGPDKEKAPFGCFWCGGSVMRHKTPCPGYDAVHQLDDATAQPSETK